VPKILALLRGEPTARYFFVALTQSALGTGAAYVALLIVAYERFRSPWAISIILIADLLPSMLLGPIFGALADRWSRKLCSVAADVGRAIAFVGIALVDGFEATVAFALLAGAGTALFKPASLAALPTLVPRPRLPAATALYGAIDDLGLAAGPAIAALLLVVSETETVFIVNGATFAVSALLLAALDFGRVQGTRASLAKATRWSLFGEVGDGLKAMRGIAGLWTVVLSSTVGLFFAGLTNVAEVPFITGELGASAAVYSASVALGGAGIVFGSLSGSAGGPVQILRRRFLIGLVVMGLGNLLLGLAPTVAVVFATFALAGVGNGAMLVHARLIIQATVPDRIAARVFGVQDASTAWAFGLSFVAAGLLISATGPRAAIVSAGVGVILAGLAAAVAMRSAEPLGRGARAEAWFDRGLGEHGANLVDRREHWLALLDDLK